MIAGIRAAWRGLRHLNQAGYIYIWCSLAWALLTIPVITAPAAWAGMVRLSWTAQRQPTAGWSDFWAGFRAHLVRGALIAVVNVVFWTIWVTNWISYASVSDVGVVVLRGVWLITAIVVIAVQLYMGPLWYAMVTPTLGGALRNAGVMLLRNPFFTLGVLLVIAVVVAVSFALPLAWGLITAGALACVVTAAVIDRLRTAGIFPDEDNVSYLVDPSFTDM